MNATKGQRVTLIAAMMAVALLGMSPAADAKKGPGGGGGGSGGGGGRCRAFENTVSLVNCGRIAGVTGDRRFRIQKDCSRDLRVRIAGAPAGTYVVLVDGVARGAMTVGALGQGQIEWDSTPDAGQLLLNFPVSQTSEIDVRQGTSTGALVLSLSADAECSTIPPPPPSCTFTETETPLATCGPVPSATGKRRIRQRTDCGRELRVEIQGVAASASFAVFVGGLQKGTIVTDGLGQGRIDFDTNPEAGEVLLDFPPDGRVDVFQVAGGALVLSSAVDASCPGTITPPPGGCTVVENEVFLVNCGAIPGASGKRRFRIRDDCTRDLRVEIQGMPPATTFDVLVDGTVRASITTDAFGQAQAEFDTTPGPGQILLNFPIELTSEIDVTRQGDGVHVLSLSVDASCSGTAPPPGGTCTPVENEVFLVNCGAIPGASGKRRFRIRDDCTRDLRVEIQSMPPATTFGVLVDGTVRASITTDAFGQAQAEFDTTPGPGQILLDFPIELTSEIDVARQSDGVHVLSLSVDASCSGTPPPPPGGTCTFSENEVFLVNCGSIAGSAKRRVRTRTDCDRDLRIEVQNVAPGSTFDIVVSGVTRGTLTADAFGQGQVEFDTTPAAGELPLNFDPTGEIDLVQGGVTRFSLSVDAACPGTAPPPPPGGSCTVVDDERNLANCGAMPAADGKRRVRVQSDCDKDLRIEIQDVPPGSFYTVYVAGVGRGTMTADGSGQAQIEFDTTPAAGELLLNFDPTGEVDVVNGTGLTPLVLSLSPSCTVP